MRKADKDAKKHWLLRSIGLKKRVSEKNQLEKRNFTRCHITSLIDYGCSSNYHVHYTVDCFSGEGQSPT